MLDNPAALALIMKKRKPESEIEPEPEMDEGAEEGESGEQVAMEDLLSAIEAKDPKLMLAAMKSFFEISESLPHEEYSEELE